MLLACSRRHASVLTASRKRKRKLQDRDSMASASSDLGHIHSIAATSAACWALLTALCHAATPRLWPQYSALGRTEKLRWCNRASSAVHVRTLLACDTVMQRGHVWQLQISALADVHPAGCCMTGCHHRAGLACPPSIGQVPSALLAHALLPILMCWGPRSRGRHSQAAVCWLATKMQGQACKAAGSCPNCLVAYCVLRDRELSVYVLPSTSG